MRNRLFVVLIAPIFVILLALGSAYAWTISRSIQQDFVSQQIGDLSYFATGARQALRADNPGIVSAEMDRYSELYGSQIAVIDRNGTIWASGAVPVHVTGEIAEKTALALSGRRSEVTATVLPWALKDTVMLEPVFDDGGVIGAVVISSSADATRAKILTYWGLLFAASVGLVLVLVVAVARLASWVLKPMRRVDQAMAAIEHGEMDARISDDTGPPEMRRMIRVFNQMAEEIERVVSKQQEFVLNASHELRNPLGAFTLRVETLATGLDETWEDEIEKTREEGRRMSRILDTLLYMATTSQKDSPFGPVDLTELVADRALAWRAAAHEKQVTFDLGAPGQVMAFTDRTSLESALDAVLDNAVKFAPGGSTIDLCVERRTDECVISVRDHGRGLEQNELSRATDRFWRSPRDQNVRGSGLGLAIATDLLAVLGGQITVSSPEGGGLLIELAVPGGDRS